jgi:hypothetical protein
MPFARGRLGLCPASDVDLSCRVRFGRRPQPGKALAGSAQDTERRPPFASLRGQSLSDCKVHETPPKTRLLCTAQAPYRGHELACKECHK